jgi:hypothetical protein
MKLTINRFGQLKQGDKIIDGVTKVKLIYSDILYFTILKNCKNES